MAQFKCQICGQEFEQRSKLLQHMQTSHPKQATSASDLQHYLKDINFPANKNDLLAHAPVNRNEELTDLIQKLPKKNYRDSAEVSRALGEAISHEDKPNYQPSEKGGKKSLKAPSASHLASLFKGVNFPKSSEEIQEITAKKGNEDMQKLVKEFAPELCFKNMADLEKEFGRVTSQKS